MINFKTGQIDSGTIGYIMQQSASCSTNKESNSVNYYDSKKSASNFNSDSLHKGNISAQKKNTDNKEEATTTSSRTPEAPPAAATSECHLEKLDTGGTVRATHALGNSSNDQLMDQSTSARPSTQPTEKEVPLTPPPPQTPPSLPPQKQSTRYIAAKALKVHEGENISRNKDEITHHTTIVVHDSQPTKQYNKQLQMKLSLAQPQNAYIADCNNNQNKENSNELTIMGHALIILQRTYKKRNDLQWHQKTPPSAPRRTQRQLGLMTTKCRPDHNKATENKNQNSPKRKKVKDMMMGVHTKITTYVNHYSETKNYAHLLLDSRREWIKNLIHNSYKDQIQSKTKGVSAEIIRKAQEPITEHQRFNQLRTNIQRLNQLRAKLQTKNKQKVYGTCPKQKTEIIRFEKETWQDRNDIIQYWRKDNSVFISELSPTTSSPNVAEKREDEKYQTSYLIVYLSSLDAAFLLRELRPFNSIKKGTTRKQRPSTHTFQDDIQLRIISLWYKGCTYIHKITSESAILASMELLSDYKDVKSKILICRISQSNNKSTLMKVSTYGDNLHEAHRNTNTTCS